MKTIGVLALQGSFAEHLAMLEKIKGIQAKAVKTTEDLRKVDSLILPGGESTTLGKLLNAFELKIPLINRINKGMPVWGTCAGLILLAKKVINESPHLGVMDISVRRNAYGSQLDSFSCDLMINEVSKKAVPAVFIRAPLIEDASGEVTILAKYKDKIVAARQNNMLVTSFHPELTDNTAFHQYFAGL